MGIHIYSKKNKLAIKITLQFNGVAGRNRLATIAYHELVMSVMNVPYKSIVVHWQRDSFLSHLSPLSFCRGPFIFAILPMA